MERKIIKNSILISANEQGGKVRDVFDNEGNYKGFEVIGKVTEFNVVNLNGWKFAADSYDKFIQSYYAENSLNIPLCLHHLDNDVRAVCGYVKELKKENNAIEIVGYIPKSAYYHTLIKEQIKDGILQGFSNCGEIIDGDPQDGGFLVKEFALLHVALVSIPADQQALIKNTYFYNFNTEEKGKASDWTW